MAPELCGDQKAYDGTKVDIFALGQVLYTMRFANHCFWKCTDSHFRSFVSDPVKASKNRGLKASTDLLDLIAGMLQPDPEKRYNLE
jgi:serine/threonine protein kinase